MRLEMRPPTPNEIKKGFTNALNAINTGKQNLGKVVNVDNARYPLSAITVAGGLMHPQVPSTDIVLHPQLNPSHADYVQTVPGMPSIEMAKKMIVYDKTDQQEKSQVELPDDIVEDDELADNGITIHNLDKKKFFIRQAALEEEPFLDWLTKNKDKGPTLDIILVDGPSVGLQYMTPEQKAIFDQGTLDSITAHQVLLGGTILANQEVKAAALEDYHNKSKELDESLKGNKIDKKKYEEKSKGLAEFFRPFLTGPTREDMFKVGGEIRIAGTDINSDLGKFYVLIPVGAPPARKPDEYPKSFFRQNDMTPHPDQSYPTLEEYVAKIVDQTSPAVPGLAARHELGHLGQDKQGRLIGYNDEDQPNQHALDRLRKAITTGDTRLFYFGFLTEEGVTLTDKRKQRPATPVF